MDKITCSYTVLWNAFKVLAKAFSPREQADLVHDTAVRVYLL